MAAKGRARSPDFARQFWPVLCHAFSECCLIVMLFVTAVGSFTATRFARIWSLRSPCILCSRLDRLLHGKTWFSEDLICAAHRLEISHLAYCQSHNKLVHTEDLCERCLLSCAGLDGKPSKLKSMRNKDKVNSRSRSRHTHLCSCCSEQFKKTRHADKLSELANGMAPDDDVSTVKERSIDMSSVGHSSDEGSEVLSYGSYRKLNVRHDSESEIRILDDDDDHVDDSNTMIQKATQRNKELSSLDLQLQPMISSANSLSIHPTENFVLAEPMNTTPPVPVNTETKIDHVATVTNLGSAEKSSEHASGHGLGEINWSMVNVTGNNQDMQSKIVPEQVNAELPKERTFLVGIEEVGNSAGVSGSPDEESGKGFAASANAGMRINRNSSMKSASGGRSNLQSPRWSEIMSAKDNNSRTHEEVKTFLSQMSSARGFDGPWSEVANSPRITQINDKQYDATGSKQFLERNYSNMEPFDVHATSDDEGESSLGCLKQKVELGKKKMSILYKELEAERSASAVAASEAMAMINRLQEEKASMHMEALQYLRMMEEQADHDQEAIERLNDLLTEREKEMLDLEAELDNYRWLHEPLDCKFDSTNGEMASGVLDSSDFMKDTMFDFEDEKANILESLSRLEETLGMSSTNRHNFGGTCISLHNISVLHSEQFSGEPVSSQQIDENQSVDSGSCSHLDDGRISSMTNVNNEISLLNTRFTALEADQKLLKQILSSLKCSDDGVHCVQEITAHLRELLRIMTEQRETAVLWSHN